MLDVLPAKPRRILLEYPFFKKYLDGKMPREAFVKYVKIYENELISRGISSRYLFNVTRDDPERRFHKWANYSRFERLARKIGLDIATLEDKTGWIKANSGDKFLDLLSIGSGFFNGIFPFLRWKGKSEGFGVVGDIFGEIFLEPPDKSYAEFKKFYIQMQQNIKPRNAAIWAVKLYFAIICAHIFENGNGRIARNAYSILRREGILDRETTNIRSQFISQAIESLQQRVIVQLLRKEGVMVNNYKQAKVYGAHLNAEDMRYYTASLISRNRFVYTMHLKYIACKRILERMGRWKVQKSIIYGQWKGKPRKEFRTEYQRVRIDWYWMCQTVIDRDMVYFQNLLDQALLN